MMSGGSTVGKRRLNMLGSGTKRIGGGATINNAGLVTLAESNLILDGAQFNNTGPLRRQGRCRSAVRCRADLDVQQFGEHSRKRQAGGVSTIGSGPNPLAFVSSGTLNAATGSLRYTAVNTFTNGTRFTGGAHVVASDTRFNGTIVSSNDLTLESGVFSGNASFPGTVTWTGGTIAGAFTVPVARPQVTGAATRVSAQRRVALEPGHGQHSRFGCCHGDERRAVGQLRRD